MDYFAGKKLTNDWTSAHFPVWEKLLAAKVEQGAAVLEIGSFEGRSALFFLQYLRRSTITCLDSFEGSDEHLSAGSVHAANMTQVEHRFDSNLDPYSGRVEKIKKKSLVALPELVAQGRVFDVIYVDGDHHANAAFFDANLAWKMLRPGGIMILDDYQWELSRPVTDRPKRGIDAFLASVAGEYEILHSAYQVIISKSTALKPAAVTLDGSTIPALKPPLVSFVVVNWNYGRYIGATIDSIAGQDYPHFECIIVDNGSVDDSRDVIARHVGADSRFRTIHLAENLGQMGATLLALGEVKGGFVAFIDSDDLLFPAYASTHLQVHLSAPRSVAITSSSVAEIDGAGALLTSQYSSINIHQNHAKRGLREPSTVIRLSTIDDERFAILGKLSATIPRWVKGWIWSPGTGNMVRKSILDAVKFEEMGTYMRSADGHFLPLCHAFAGTVLIDVPLSAYRIHGQNYFMNNESLYGLRHGSSEYSKQSRADSYQSVGSVLARVRQNAWLLGDEFWRVVDMSARVHDRDLKSYYQTDEGRSIFRRHARVLRETLGDKNFANNILVRFGAKTGFGIIETSFSGRPPLSAYTRTLRYVFSKSKRKANKK